MKIHRLLTLSLILCAAGRLAPAGERTALETFEGTAVLRAAGDRRVLVALDVRNARGVVDGRAEQLFLIACREAPQLTDLTGRFPSRIEYNGYLGSLRVARLDGELAVANGLFSIGIRENTETAVLGCSKAFGVSRVGISRKLVTLDDVNEARAVEDCPSAPGTCWEIAGSRYVFPG